MRPFQRQPARRLPRAFVEEEGEALWAHSGARHAQPPDVAERLASEHRVLGQAVKDARPVARRLAQRECRGEHAPLLLAEQHAVADALQRQRHRHELRVDIQRDGRVPVRQQGAQRARSGENLSLVLRRHLQNRSAQPAPLGLGVKLPRGARVEVSRELRDELVEAGDPGERELLWRLMFKVGRPHGCFGRVYDPNSLTDLIRGCTHVPGGRLRRRQFVIERLVVMPGVRSGSTVARMRWRKR